MLRVELRYLIGTFYDTKTRRRRRFETPAEWCRRSSRHSNPAWNRSKEKVLQHPGAKEQNMSKLPSQRLRTSLYRLMEVTIDRDWQEYARGPVPDSNTCPFSYSSPSLLRTVLYDLDRCITVWACCRGLGRSRPAEPQQRPQAPQDRKHRPRIWRVH